MIDGVDPGSEPGHPPALASDIAHGGVEDALRRTEHERKQLAASVEQLEARLDHQARHDPLTGLPDRAVFLELLAGTLGHAAPSSIAVMFLDLDHFKVVNDSLGHEAGDRLLVAVARRLEQALRDGDVVARFGDDEFTVLCRGLTESSEAADLAERLLATLATPFGVAGEQVFLSASIGLAIPNSTDEAAEVVMRHADLALYWAKQRGKNRVECASDVMRARAEERLALERELRRALREEQFAVYYQPMVRLDGRRAVAFEALVRWNHPDRGLLPPSEFIAVAEANGLVVQLGAWVITQVCRQIALWKELAVSEHHPIVSINLSARQLLHTGLVDEVAASIREAGIASSDLCLEITESVMLEDTVSVIERLEGLRDLGIELTVDDFGTGYSSLGYLKRLPVSSVKVDRSFVNGLGRDADDSAIVAAVVSMAHALGLEVVAEGVETAEQIVELEALGCDLAQGNYFAKPQLANVVTSLLRHPLQWRRRPAA
jgi:diguanylate cyclase (GGDEF)-like protein